MTDAELDQFAVELGLTDRVGSWCFKPLIQLLAAGAPVSLDALAATTGRDRSAVLYALADVPSIEFDVNGNVVGAGLTLTPTPHRFVVDGRTLYTWCALDTLIFPALLGCTAAITSVTPGSGTPVHVTVTPHTVASVDPVTAVVSILQPTTNPDVRVAFCNQVHFFNAAGAAAGWLA
ncbi:MAG: organomercurial lyase MerB [Herpetosiphon sp.]